jgi:hypothetical protein
MIKELILLAVSKKYGRFCVAGIDRHTGSWHRLVSYNSDAHYALSEEEIRLSNTELAKKLDIVRVCVCDQAISYFQTENYVISKAYVWEKLGEADIDDVIRIHPPDQAEYIFYDTHKSLSRDHYKDMPVKDIRSLMLISVQHATVQIRQQDKGRRVKIKLTYKDREYEPLPVTDLEFLSLCAELKPRDYPIRKAGIMLLSVGECYEKDHHHYKLIAGIMLK